MIIRQPERPDAHFLTMPNAWARDDRLSRRARGLLAELLSHQDGWSTSIEDLVRKGPEGRDAVQGAVKELRDLGYLVLQQDRARGGRMREATYTITDSDSPPTAFQEAVDQYPVDRGPVDQEAYKKTTSKNTRKNPTENEPPRSRAATEQQLWLLRPLLAELERHGEIPDELGELDLQALTRGEADAAIKAAYRELHHIAMDADRLGDAFPDLAAELERAS